MEVLRNRNEKLDRHHSTSIQDSSSKNQNQSKERQKEQEMVVDQSKKTEIKKIEQKANQLERIHVHEIQMEKTFVNWKDYQDKIHQVVENNKKKGNYQQSNFQEKVKGFEKES